MINQILLSQGWCSIINHQTMDLIACLSFSNSWKCVTSGRMLVYLSWLINNTMQKLLRKSNIIEGERGAKNLPWYADENDGVAVEFSCCVCVIQNEWCMGEVNLERRGKMRWKFSINNTWVYVKNKNKNKWAVFGLSIWVFMDQDINQTNQLFSHNYKRFKI